VVMAMTGWVLVFMAVVPAAVAVWVALGDITGLSVVSVVVPVVGSWC
jgi:hypothetical protein